MLSNGKIWMVAACVVPAAACAAAAWLRHRYRTSRRTQLPGESDVPEAASLCPAAVGSVEAPTQTDSGERCRESAPPVPEAVPAPAGETAGESTVWWTPGGHSYHKSVECMTLRRSHAEQLRHGTVAQAHSGGKTVLCRRCGAQRPS